MHCCFKIAARVRINSEALEMYKYNLQRKKLQNNKSFVLYNPEPRYKTQKEAPETNRGFQVTCNRDNIILSDQPRNKLKQLEFSSKIKQPKF